MVAPLIAAGARVAAGAATRGRAASAAEGSASRIRTVRRITSFSPKKQADTGVKSRIDPIIGFIMFGIAAVFDGIQVILTFTPLIVMSTFFGIFGSILFFVWFYLLLKGDYFTGKFGTWRFFGMGTTTVFEFIPGIGGFTWLMVAVGATLYSIWKEDRERAKEAQEAMARFSRNSQRAANNK